MGRGGGRGGGGFSSGGGRGFSSHRSSGSSMHRGGGAPRSSVGRSSRPSTPPMMGRTSRPMSPPPPRPPRMTPPIIISPWRRSVHTRTVERIVERPVGTTSANGAAPTNPQTQAAKAQSSWIPAWYKWLMLVVVGVVLVLVIASSSARGVASGVNREKLPASACISSNVWMDDRIGWLSDTGKVKQALQYFYDKTGVQPYLLICDSLDGKGGSITDAEAKEALETLYDTLYDDEGHMIFTFMEYAPSEYITWIYTGRAADAVIDADAREVILSNADRYYTDSSLSDDQFFAKVFTTSADALMKDYAGSARMANVMTVCSIVIVIVMAGGLLLFKLREQKMRERAQLEQVLNTPIGSSAEEAELERKYGKQEDSNT